MRLLIQDAVNAGFKPPETVFVGGDRKIFTLTGIAQQALNGVGRDDLKTEMTHRIFKADSYDMALGIIREYVLDIRLSQLAKPRRMSCQPR